jgi:hypothetical protein
METTIEPYKKPHAEIHRSYRIDPQTVLTALLPQNPPRLLFYPSAGDEDGFVCDFDADILIFSDYRHKFIGTKHELWRKFLRFCTPHAIDEVGETEDVKIFRIDQRKWGLFFFLDNNSVLKLIQQSGYKIFWFIGKNDGCREGGNYECVNKTEFFSKILKLMSKSGMTYITDHGTYYDLLVKSEKSPFDFVVGNSQFTGKFISEYHKHSEGGYGPVKEFHIRKKTHREYF